MMPSAGASRSPPSSTARSTPRCPGIPRPAAADRTHPPHGRRPPAMPSRPCNPSHQPRRPTPPWHSDAESPPPCTGRVRVPRRCRPWPHPAAYAPVAAAPGIACAAADSRTRRPSFPHSVVSPDHQCRSHAGFKSSRSRQCGRTPSGYPPQYGTPPRCDTPKLHSCHLRLFLSSCARQFAGRGIFLRSSVGRSIRLCNRTVAGSSPAAGATTEKPLDSRGFSHIAATACDRDASSITHAR